MKKLNLKNWLLVFCLAISYQLSAISLAHAQSSTGASGVVDFNFSTNINPSVTPINGVRGTLLQYIPDPSGTAQLFMKQDDGTTTDWIPFITSGGGGGTVTSVGLALPSSVFTVSGSPVTTVGTLTGAFTSQSANTVFAGPASGGSAVPTFRALTAADIPSGIYANTFLSNLTSPTSINQNLIPDGNSFTFGNPTNFWQYAYITVLRDGGDVNSILPGNRTLNDGTGVIDLNWALRSLSDTAGNDQLEWSPSGVEINTALTMEGATSGAFTQEAAATTTSYSVLWPPAQGGASTFLENDGAGNLSWSSSVGAFANQSLSNLT